MVSPLLAGAPGSRGDNTKAIVFVADPDVGQIGTTEVLESLYDLTHAEADMVRLLSEVRPARRVQPRVEPPPPHAVRTVLPQVDAAGDGHAALAQDAPGAPAGGDVGLLAAPSL